ncbi:hypothetical protein BJ165DRAFT_1399715 [Panaeolus papilionaceus]|nr:hypothetical protein BJ165DRAFT_1399715 [Panaeolus papilionaceus]
MDLHKSDQEPQDGVSILTNADTRLEDIPQQSTADDVSAVPLTPTPPPPATVSSPSTPPSATPSSSTQDIPLQPQIMQPQLAQQQQPDQVDAQILEALRSKDRIFVLKLGETFEALIKESRPRVELSPNSSYHRLLVHRCSAYYKLVPESDPLTKGIAVVYTPESRIPDRRLCDLIPPEPHTHPAIQIMRRPRSLASSVAGEEADLSDVEPSESGSLGGRSNPTSSSGNNASNPNNPPNNKKHMTIEEREAAYKMARERIFMDFQEKPEKGKGKDGDSGVSASLSMLSLNSGGGGGSTSASVSSTSAGGRSSFLGDTDDGVSSPATESEWSGPVASVVGGHQNRGEHHGNKRESGRRGGPVSTSAGSSRSLRNDRGFHGSGSGSSSRNSRAPSPSSSFAYPTLYEPPPSVGQIYDPNQHHQHQHPHAGANPAAAAGMGYMNPTNQYTAAYPYAGAPGQGHGPPYMAPTAYPYYSQPYHPYQMQHIPPPPPQAQQPHPGQHSAGGHTSPPPAGSEPYSPQHQHQHPMHYGHPYAWGQPAPHPQTMQSPPPPSHVHPIAHHHIHPSHAQPHQQNHNTTSAHSMGPPPPPPGPPPPQQAASPAGAYPGYPAYGYPTQPMPMNGYYPPPGPPQQVPVGGMPPGPAGAPQQGPPGQQHGYIDPRGMNGHVPPQGQGAGPAHHNPNNVQGAQNQRNGYGSPNGSMNGGRNNRNASNGSGGGVGKTRPGPPGASSARAPWSYGPNVGGGTTVQASHGGTYGYNVAGGSDTNLGPRFTASHRRPSGNSSSGNSRGSSNFDDTLSISSTSTSSSSTSTNTLVSTASSQHPLPQRPDWAVGLKAQPSLAGNRHMPGSMSSSPMRTNSHNSTTSSTSSNSSRHGSNHASPLPPASTDFPPLTTGPGAIGEKKVPVPGGAWGTPRNGILGLNGTHVDGERGAGKPGDLISPKIVRRPGGPPQPNGGQGYRSQQQQGHSPQQGQLDRTRDAANAIIEQVSGMTLEENEADAAQVSTPIVASTSPAAAAGLAASASAA